MKRKHTYEREVVKEGDKSTANDYDEDNNDTNAWDKQDLKKDVRTTERTQENVANSVWRNILFTYPNIPDIKK